MPPTRILRLDCSPRTTDAHCWRIANELQHRLETASPGATTVQRVLARQPAPFVDHDFARTMGANTTPESARAVPALATSETLIGELESTQALIIATPMHNYTVPAVLKAWIDQVVRVGRTFTITPQGKVGALRDRPAFIVVSSGGFYTGDAARQPDFLTPYMTAILATIGIANVAFIRMEGLTRGDDSLARAYAGARAEIASLELR
jgi:FMN-dependent NADH-azoreductase